MVERLRKSGSQQQIARPAQGAAETKADVATQQPAAGWSPRTRTTGSRPAVQVAALQQPPDVVAKQNANIDQVFALKKLGPGNIPENLLPTQHPMTVGNKFDFLVDGDAVFPKLIEDLRGAKDSIHISHFAVGDDKLGRELGAVLMAKARAGVEVRVLMDPSGSGALMPFFGATNKMLDEWEKAGVQVIRNRHIDPTRTAEPLNHPEHRKFYIVDGKTAWTGGMGMQEKYRSEWHDTMIRVEGEGTRQMQVDFLKTWQHLGGHIDQKGGSDAKLRERFFPEAGTPGRATLQGISQIPGEAPQIREAYLREIKAAKHSFYIENPYFTDARVLTALKDAAKRGVDVRVVVPGKTDMPLTLWAARGEYDGLLAAGVKMYEYHGKQGMTHAKVAVRDGGEWSTTGSANLDSLSMNHLYEFNYQSTSPELGGQISQMIQRDIGISHEITPADTRGISNYLYKILDTSVLSYFM